MYYNEYNRPLSGRPYFKATSDTVFYEAIIPAQKAGSTVYWLIVVTNENGLSSVTEAQQYSVYAI